MEPWFRLCRPLFFGWENIPADRPLLFVGNHTLYGVIDAPILFLELLQQKNIFLRSLGDRFHFHVPIWRDLLQRYGVVEGSRENCGRLMKQGESILVFPGGGREVAKKKGEKYKLVWKKRMGFARMAIEHHCTIVPFSAVGVEDMFDVLLDSDAVMASPLGSLLRKFNIRTDVILPLSVGTGPMKLPRLERFYFQFAPPISTADYAGDFENKEACWQLRERTREAIEDGLQQLIEFQHNDPERWLTPSLSQLAQQSMTWLSAWRNR